MGDVKRFLLGRFIHIPICLFRCGVVLLMLQVMLLKLSEWLDGSGRTKTNEPIEY